MFQEQVILGLPCPPAQVPLVREVRGTLLGSSIQGLRDQHRQDDYFELLELEYHDAIRGLVPSTWLPIEVGVAHYRAVGGLGFTQAEERAMGRRVAERVQHSWAGTVIRGFRATGAVTPLKFMSRFQQAWDRLMRGGHGAVYQVGPKDMRVECHGCPLLAVPYVRNGWAGMFESTLELISKQVYVRELPRYTSGTTCAFHIAWV